MSDRVDVGRLTEVVVSDDWDVDGSYARLPWRDLVVLINSARALLDEPSTDVCAIHQSMRDRQRENRCEQSMRGYYGECEFSRVRLVATVGSQFAIEVSA